MAKMDTATRIEQLLENDYAQEQLREGIDNLRSAYGRASKRRVKPARDERLRRQVQAAVSSLTEAAKAFNSGRQKPKPRWGRRLLLVAAVGGAIAVGVGLAMSGGRDQPESSAQGA